MQEYMSVTEREGESDSSASHIADPTIDSRQGEDVAFLEKFVFVAVVVTLVLFFVATTAQHGFGNSSSGQPKSPSLGSVAPRRH